MNSRYDGIETAADLIKEVQNNGLSTAQEDLCRAQDIFGNSSVGELDRLANDIGRNNDQGEPDPKGTWSSNRKPTQSTFYMIAFVIWNWEEAVRFWNLHTNPEHKALQETERNVRSLESERKELTAKLEREQEARITVEKGYNRLTDRCGEAECRAETAETEIIILKAKLYDRIMKEEETE